MSNEDEEKEIETNKSANEDSKGESAAVLVKDVPSSNSIATKRKRSDLSISTASTAELPTWVAGTSPAKFVSMDELMKMSEALENMALVHEIAINPEFVIEKNPANQIERMVEDCIKKAYWDKLREDLTRIPPDYSCALTLLDDIKKVISIYIYATVGVLHEGQKNGMVIFMLLIIA
ncbi:unnamed protein product [Brugia pahangi]|uniref:Intraflagellar transport protein 46 homolog n=1 Tax=Brugia pahangi TaxID=6280 RepID=A0A0N4T8X0_BRUPA|nr:unnamed protein product [Brugia pahangi]